MHHLTSLLSQPACRLIEPIKLDFNFIEVSDGYCFDIQRKKFIRSPKTMKGSPRAYVRYDCKKKPHPAPFIEGIKYNINYFFLRSGQDYNILQRKISSHRFQNHLETKRGYL